MRSFSLLLVCFVGAVSAFVAPPTTLRTTHLQQRGAAADISMGAPSKATRVNIRNREYNKMYKSEMRTRIKRVGEAVKEGDYTVAAPLLSKAFQIIDKNVKRNIVHKNTAGRKKSQLALQVKALEGITPGSAPAAAAEEPAA